MDSTIVQYFQKKSAGFLPARMLLFNNAIQLYSPDENSFIAAYPYNGISLIAREQGSARFSLLPDRSAELEVPEQHFLLTELLKATNVKLQKRKKRMGKLVLPAALLAMAGLAAALYYLLVAGVSSIGLQLISPKKEAELGKMIYSSMVSGMPVDTAAGVKLAAFAEKLKLSENYTLHFTVVDEKEVNAFAIPGGHIVVYKGILQQMQRPEELAALLGHEASHVNERHSLRNMLQELTGTFVLSLVLGDMGALGTTIAGNANKLRSLSYSRGLEEEADEKGMERLLQNSVDPKGMIWLMDRLKESEKEVSMPGFLSTHPLTEERKASAQKFVSKHPGGNNKTAALEESWTALKEATR
ncbi:M48 family metallopeptidase [Flavihumibacter stibioxidans]|uniref:Peptidase M48 domain-containing protein n=1 Tax=Flavihumibacter stibioxidans TaxID=1834163 RepID=A0ABR7MCK8_9BACT|nr:M48 family metallopeptidase [Flavihumibacter stibioxidans]MBC6492278.1 hypothetical protein [Flavihumibacter stibioxidans]